MPNRTAIAISAASVVFVLVLEEEEEEEPVLFVILTTIGVILVQYEDLRLKRV